MSLTAARPAHAASLTDYREALYRALAYVEHAQTAGSKEERARDVDRAVAALVAVPEVTLPDGTTLPVDNDHVLHELHKQVPDLQRAAGYLRALLAEVDRLLQAQTVAAPDAEESLARVLRDPQFRRSPALPIANPDLVQQILDGWSSLLADPLHAGSQVIFEWVLPLAGALLAAIVLALFARGLWQNLAPEATTSDSLAADEAHLDAKTAHAWALERARAGDTRAAIRYLYLSALLSLDERGLLRFDRTLTNREYLRALRDHATLRRLLSPVVGTFDRAWYGRIPVTEEEFQEYQRQVADVRAVERSPETRR